MASIVLALHDFFYTFSQSCVYFQKTKKNNTKRREAREEGSDELKEEKREDEVQAEERNRGREWKGRDA